MTLRISDPLTDRCRQGASAPRAEAYGRACVARTRVFGGSQTKSAITNFETRPS
ncbi:hypothetical protein [Streptomyces sp. MMG1533]|uniref:hypothetical protein n=1 Tax=Streptomyces sp. MMG1533 TaxID=1415546 RepID=UPI00131A7947|nr:hypothetical protein [Streptomyces sp. MMG1533]